MKSLQQLADLLGLEYKGNGDCRVHSVATLKNAGSEQLSFLANPRYKKELMKTQAGIVILDPQHLDSFNGNVLISSNPYLSFAKAAQLFHKQPELTPGIHTTAVIDPSAVIDPTASIGALVCIGPRSTVGAGVIIGSSVCIDEGVSIGNGTLIHAGVKLQSRTQLGACCIIQPGAVIGGDGFGFAPSEKGWEKIPQVGKVVIGDDCEIGANTTIDRGAIDDTVLGNGVKLDNQIQIGHNVTIGEHTIIAGCTAIAGSAEIGAHCMIGGGVGIVGHICIVDKVTIQAMSLVTHSINKPGNYSAASPLQESRQWRRNAVRYRQLDKLASRISILEDKYEN